MDAVTRVDFHCHSTYSDGALLPREVAAALADDHVGFASLTDHDCLDGLRGFRHGLARRGIGFITGVEMTVSCHGREAHLLGYGFDPDHEELRATLASIRRARAAHSVVGSMRDRPRRRSQGTAAAPSNTGVGGWIDIADAIALIQRAGGRAFLAHPLVLEPDPDRVRDLLAELRGAGLDGVEAYYGGHTPDQRERLAEMAEELGLLVCGGSDAHDRRGMREARLGVDMPTERWKRFRDAVCCGSEAGQAGIEAEPPVAPRVRLRRRHFLFHVVFPTVLAIGLFVAAIFAVFLPAFERSLMERKREMIRELTNSAWTILDAYHRNELAGAMSREQAQRLAISDISALRYGPEGKDYFWLQDMTPRMIMHPYRPDLNGRDVSDFRDPRGVPIFVEFADLVRRQGEGYIDYVWQWKDDPERLAPKQSYIKGFEPWGWIIGTGLYTEDVRREIAAIERRLVRTSVAISALVLLLLLYVMQQSLRLERERRDAEEGLRESTARYRSVVEATTEGTLVVLAGRLRYANPIMLRLLGTSARELELLDLDDVLPRDEPANAQAWEHIDRAAAGEEPAGGFEGVLRRRDGEPLECLLALSRMIFAGRGELVLLVKPVGPTAGALQAGQSRPVSGAEPLDRLSEAMPAGIFRARAGGRGTVLAASRAAARLLGGPDTDDATPLTLAAVFDGEGAWQDFLAEVLREGAAERRLRVAAEGMAARTIAIRAVPAADDEGESRFLDGVVEDVTVQERRAAEREAIIERLQASMLFLHEPVSRIGRNAVFCALDAPVRDAAAVMTARRSSAVLVRSESGRVVGIFTDRDLRERIVARGGDPATPVYRVMTSPVVSVSEHAGIYEALMAMEGHGIGHLAVADDTGEIVGVVCDQDLLGFPSYGPIVLAREIEGADTAPEVAAACRRAPGLARALLDGGARPGRVTRMLTSVCDAAVERLVALAQEQLGPAPAPFAFLALGSHGRQELVLSSDQDNALIYADVAEDEAEAVASYFQELGRMVCDRLDAAGYRYCEGEVMAANPRWCQPLSAWRRYFSEWVHGDEPRQLLEFSTFFDFRAVCGRAELASELRAHLFAELAARPMFFVYLAQNALVFKPPLRLFGRIIMGGTGGDAPGQVNVKDALIPIIAFARLYALRERLDHTHTLDRLDALAEAGVLTEAGREQTVAAYDTLMRLRLQHQAEDLDTDQAPDNLLTWRALGHLEQTLLGQAYQQVAAVQERISHDFLGGRQAP